MYQINKVQNKITKLKECTFSELKFKEREHLQEWQVIKYASYCSSLTKDNIKDIYQSYLNKHYKDKSAEELLVEFFDGQEYEELELNKGATQRIILVAGKFRKEVTSSVLWLMNYNIRAQCI